MCAVTEKMVNLNKNKKRQVQSHYKVQLKWKNVKKSAIQFFVTKPAVS